MKQIVLATLLLFSLSGFSQYIFEGEKCPEMVNLQKFAQVINVNDLTLDIQSAIAQFDTVKSKQHLLHDVYYGFSKDNYWAQISVQNNTKKKFRYLLQTALPSTELVELYIVDERTKKTVKSISGSSIHRLTKVLESKEVLFNLVIKPADRLSLYVVPLVLHSYNHFYKKMVHQEFRDGLFYGLVLQFSIFMFFLFFALRSFKILFLSIFILASGFLPFIMDGYFSKYFTVFNDAIVTEIFLMAIVLTGIFLGKFAESTLLVRRNNKKLYFLFQLFYAINIILLPLGLLFPESLNVLLMIANVLGSFLFVLIVIAMLCFKNKFRFIELFFIFGITVLGMSYGIYTLKIYAVLPSSFLVEESTKIGIAITIVLFTIKEVFYLFNLRKTKKMLAQDTLAKAQEMRDLKCYLLCNISHELRTPLNVIMNYNENILEKTKDSDILEKCLSIQNSSENLLNSIDDILDFTKIEKHELKAENVTFDPLDAILSLKQIAQARAEEKGLQFIFNHSDVLPSLVSGDKKKYLQIINHVIDNALKFTPVGSVTMSLSVTKVKKGKVTIVVGVSDSGIGISEKKMGKIFDSFSQYKTNNKRKFGGLGLGLYLVRNLVDMLGGDFKIDSKIGKGTSCEIFVDFEVVEIEKPLLEVFETIDYDLKGKTILVVEDNKMNQVIIKMIVKQWENTNVIFANNGLEGLNAFAKDKIDLVLMDLQMPVMDGYEASIAIRNGSVGKENKDVPIIAVTADVMEATKARVVEIGMDAYLSKPIDKRLLYKTITKCLANKAK